MFDSSNQRQQFHNKMLVVLNILQASALKTSVIQDTLSSK